MQIIFLIFALILLIFVVANTMGFLTGAPFAPTPKKNIKTLLKALKLTKKDLIIDLGSGDGRLLIEVSKFKAGALGFEINPFLYLITKFRIRSLDNTEVRLADFWNQDLSSGTVIFAFILPEFMKGLEKKFIQELKPKTIVITYLASLPNKKPTGQISGFNIYIF